MILTQVHANGTKGDLADSFAFHTFFPNVIQPPVALICNAIFAVLVRLRLCRKPVRRYDIAAPQGAGGAISISLPGAEPSHDTERRRQIALRALSERLNRGATPPLSAQQQQQESAELLNSSGEANSWPNLEGEATVHVPVEAEAEAKAESHQAGEPVVPKEDEGAASAATKEEVLVDIEGK